MKYKDFTTRAELYRAAADSLEMQQKAGVVPKYRYQGSDGPLDCVGLHLTLDHYEFPVGIVESKCVWLGDTLYTCTGVAYTAKKTDTQDDLQAFFWNPPKPKTVMVELLVDDISDFVSSWEGCTTECSSRRMAIACQAALEKLNAAN